MSVYKYVNMSAVVSGDMLKICQFSFCIRYIYSLLYHYVMCNITNECKSTLNYGDNYLVSKH